MWTISSCLKGNHKPKSLVSPNVSSPAEPQPAPQIGLFPITSLLFHTVQTLAAPVCVLGHRHEETLSLWVPFKQLPSCLCSECIGIWSTVCQGDREHQRGRALGTASPCYRAVPLLKDILKLSSLPVLCWFPMATSPLISHCNLVSIYTWALWLVPYICQEALC